MFPYQWRLRPLMSYTTHYLSRRILLKIKKMNRVWLDPPLMKMNQGRAICLEEYMSFGICGVLDGLHLPVGRQAGSINVNIGPFYE